MTDVIRTINSNQVTSTSSKNSSKVSNESTAGPSTQQSINNTPTDKVDLTNAAQKIDSIVADLASEPVVDRQKVDSIKAALENGSYEVNSSMIAERLIEIDELLK